MGLGSALEKLAFYLLILFIFYVICERVGLRIKPLDDLASWLSQNFPLIVFMICFLALLLAIYKIAKLWKAEIPHE